ncbi:hypothetical protein C2134_02870 [Chromobacterium sinusclupearum]|uniref:Uncharacterized protein n=1 Tax=Chromobacterium sinusclupearum TaxID=2077146 RepID=A0A2K4MSS3_9NEIS|nr:hypothetical protein C2134_02870 [Chromobacterium sinusclupearum]
MPARPAGQSAVSESRQLANYVLARMKGLFPDRLTKKLPSMELVQLFVATLADEMERRGITRDMVEAGLRRIASECEWPPIDVPVFLRFCMPVRDYEAAFREAQRLASMRHQKMGGQPEDWSHPAVYWAASRFGWFEMRNSSWQAASARWVAVLDEVLTWRQWPKIDRVAITVEGGLQTKAVQRRELANMRQILAGAVAGGAAAPGFERDRVVE